MAAPTVETHQVEVAARALRLHFAMVSLNQLEAAVEVVVLYYGAC